MVWPQALINYRFFFSNIIFFWRAACCVRKLLFYLSRIMSVANNNNNNNLLLVANHQSRLQECIEEIQELRQDSKRCTELVQEMLSRVQNNKKRKRAIAIDENAPTSDKACIVCLVNKKIIAFGCGHLSTCSACSQKLSKCPLCRTKITFSLRVFD